MPTLSLAANVGLVLFLFLVGLEVDLRLLIQNWRIALSVGAAGMALPFGLGIGIAYGLYHQFRMESGAFVLPISILDGFSRRAWYPMDWCEVVQNLLARPASP